MVLFIPGSDADGRDAALVENIAVHTAAAPVKERGQPHIAAGFGRNPADRRVFRNIKGLEHFRQFQIDGRIIFFGNFLYSRPDLILRLNKFRQLAAAVLALENDLVADHVGGRSAGDHGKVCRGKGGQAAVRQMHDQVRRYPQRVQSLFRLVARMGLFAVHRDHDLAHAGGLFHNTAGPAGNIKYETHLRPEAAQVRIIRAIQPNLFTGGNNHFNVPVRQVLFFHVAQRLQHHADAGNIVRREDRLFVGIHDPFFFIQLRLDMTVIGHPVQMAGEQDGLDFRVAFQDGDDIPAFTAGFFRRIVLFHFQSQRGQFLLHHITDGPFFFGIHFQRGQFVKIFQHGIVFHCVSASSLTLTTGAGSCHKCR